MLTELCIKIKVAEVMLEDQIDRFLRDEDGGVNIIAIVVILAITLALAVVFRSKIKELFDDLWRVVTDNKNNFGNYP